MIKTTLSALLALLRAVLMPRAGLALENAVLRQQLAVYIRTQKRPRLRDADRAFWIALYRFWPDSTRSLVIVKPATVVGWHRKGFKAFWRRKSRPGKIGRPRIPRTHIAFFSIAYVFAVLEVGTRRIVHVNVTSHPTLPWVKQQIREATGSDIAPRFLVHDNDGIFGQLGRPVAVQRDGKTRSYRCHLDQWLGEVMCIEGLPIPYGAPNASPYVERFNRTLREDALNDFIFLSVDHIRRVVAEYIRCYNGARPSQAIHGIPDPYPELRRPPPPDGKLVALPVLGGVQHDYRLVVA